eukprot:m.193536 g.193536  ORF g.193536 m.193536 type:complete len:257 (+) comp18295_c0_seq2:25-795(+)
MAQIPHRPQPCSLPFSVPVHHKQLRDGTTAVRLVLNPSLDWPGVPKRDFVRDNKSLPREASAKRKRMQAVVRANQHTEQHRPGFIPKSSRRLPEAAPELDCPSRVGPHRHDRVPGELPKYLRDRKTAWAAQQAYDDSHAQDPRAPPGYRLISEQERAARLAHLLDIYHACMASLRASRSCFSKQTQKRGDQHNFLLHVPFFDAMIPTENVRGERHAEISAATGSIGMQACCAGTRNHAVFSSPGKLVDGVAGRSLW